MIIKSPFVYTPMNRTEVNGIRHYSSPTGIPLPSVTTILAATSDKTYIEEWKSRVGEEEAKAICETASMLGTGMHDNLERYVLTNAKPTGNYMTQVLTKLIIKNGLKNVSEVWGAEVPLYHTDLYAGTCDLVGIHNGVPAIMDYKNSLKTKKKEWITDYFLQLSAYAMAHDWRYGTAINKGVIMMATREGNYLEFIIEGEEFQSYQYQWCQRVSQYYDSLILDK